MNSYYKRLRSHAVCKMSDGKHFGSGLISPKHDLGPQRALFALGSQFVRCELSDGRQYLHVAGGG